MEPIRQTQVQSVLLSKIHPNPNQPRHVITDEMIEAMAASLKSAGIKNPVKLRPLPDGQFEIISGHIRAAGARKLDWETVPALVLDLTPEQALLESILDNRGQEMTWLDLYQSIESLQKVNPNLTQQELGERLEVVQPVVSRALNLLGLLNGSARDQIYKNLINSDPYKVPENAVYRLADLKTPENVEKALKVVLDRHMTEPQAGHLVAWVLQTGKDPSEYPPQTEKKGGEVADTSDPNASYWNPLPSYMHVRKTPKGYRVVMDLIPAQGPLAVYGAMSWLESLKGAVEGGSPDPQYQNALPQLLEEAKKQLSEEKRLRTEAEANAKAKTEALARKKAAAKAEAKNAFTALKTLKKTQAQREAQGMLGAMSELLKMKVSENLGQGTLTEMVVKAAHNGQTAKALKLYGDGLAHLGKTAEEQKTLLEEAEDTMKQMADLKRQLIPLRQGPGGQAVLGSQPIETAPDPTKVVGTPKGGDEAPGAGSGVVGQVLQEAKDKINLTPQSVTDALVKDAKQVVNYEIRKGMKDILKDVF